MPYFAYIVGGWVQKEGKFCLRNKSMAHKVFFCFSDLFPQNILPTVSVVTSSPNNTQSFKIETGSDPDNGVQVIVSVSQSQNQSQYSNSALLTKYILELLMQRRHT